MLRATLFFCFLAVVAARNLEVDQIEPLTKDAEVEQKSEPVEAVEVSANEGRDFEFFPFRTSLRIPQLRPTGFSLFRRPVTSDIFSVPSERVEDTSADTSGDAEFLPAGGSTVAAPNRRPVLFPSLGEIFGDFNRRMQVFEDEISNLFRTFVRGPDRTGIRDPIEPSEEDSSYEQRPAFPGFGLFRPFRPTFGGNGGFFGFRNPSEFPDDYKNSTSSVKVVNGTKVMVNETISKGGDENSSHFVHFKVIHMLPEDETTDATVEEVSDRKEDSTEFMRPDEESMELPRAELNDVESRDDGYFMDDPGFRSVSTLDGDLDVNRARYDQAKRSNFFKPDPEAQLFGEPDMIPTQLLERNGPWA